MSEQVVKQTRESMEKTIDSVRHQLAKIQTGRATTALVEDLPVDYYGNKTPLKQMAHISVPENRQILIQPWDQSAVSAVEKAITSSNLGLSPRMEGKSIRLMIPQMTEERRKEMKKVIDDYTEKGRIAVRANRQDGIKAIRAEEANGMSEDDGRRFQEEVQKLTDAKIAEIDKLHEEKVKDLMTV
jgi:ribosome recycling factor